jgi:hypothetical protein
MTAAEAGMGLLVNKGLCREPILRILNCCGRSRQESQWFLGTLGWIKPSPWLDFLASLPVNTENFHLGFQLSHLVLNASPTFFEGVALTVLEHLTDEGSGRANVAV